MENRKEASQPAEYQVAVRGRLNELKDRYGLSEIARRTQTPLTNVHRYMREGKVPVEFCSALVDAFEVNPAWLLTGAGGALLSEVDPGTAKLGGSMLELVHALNAVARMRLGALAGKDQEKKLRELGDAIDLYERLRERMNAQTRPLMRELVNRFSMFHKDMQLDRAEGVRKAALQVSRFCDDEKLLYDFDRLQAMHEHLCGRVDNALKFHQRLFSRNLLEGGLATKQGIEEAGNYVLSLRDSARLREGLRVCQAALDLTPEEMRGTHDCLELECIAGGFQIELGDIRVGLARIHAAYQATAPESRAFVAIFKARGELLADLTSLGELRRRDNPSRGRTRLLMREAALAEDTQELHMLVGESIGDALEQVPSIEYESHRALLIDALLTGRKGDHLRAYEKLLQTTPPPVNSPPLRAVMSAIHLAQAARLAGARAKAEAHTLAANQAVDATPAEFTIMIDLLGLHARNVALCLPAKKHADLRRRWHRWLEEHIALGYGFLRRFVTAP